MNVSEGKQGEVRRKLLQVLYLCLIILILNKFPWVPEISYALINIPDETSLRSCFLACLEVLHCKTSVFCRYKCKRSTEMFSFSQSTFWKVCNMCDQNLAFMYAQFMMEDLCKLIWWHHKWVLKELFFNFWRVSTYTGEPVKHKSIKLWILHNTIT